MGVYAWNEDLLIYYYADGYYMLCRVDSATGETLGQTEPSFVRELQIEFCQDNVTLLSEFAGHEGQNEIKIQDGILTVSRKRRPGRPFFGFLIWNPKVFVDG